MITAVDLFCGAGGASTGLLQAAEQRGQRVHLTAVNHWPTAVSTHTANHPEARHYCTPIEALEPRDAVPGGKLDILIAAPECTHHSTARGGKPINDQSRAGAWQILRWLDHLRVDHLLIENVPEFRTWGPLGANNRPIKTKKGETFRAFIAAIESYGYRVEYRVLNSADYGAATTRRRLFIQAKRTKGAIAWPAPTHSRTGSPTLFGGTKKWRGAREVIDWSLQGESIFRRKRPLAPATMRRILEGLRRFGGAELQPFLVAMEHGGRVVRIDSPVPTITTAKGGAFAVVEPFILPQHGGAIARPASEPMPTVATDGAIGLIEPMLAEYYGNGQVRPVSEPMPTVTTRDRFALVQPVVDGRVLDIRFRMLQPHELAAAMSFPEGYQFTGNKGDQVKQIGNAWDVAMGRALFAAILESKVSAPSRRIARIA